MSTKIPKQWNANNIEDLNGKVAIVTGSSSGIGLETACVLAGKNATTIVAVRNEQKGAKAIEEIKEKFPSADVNLMILDLADLQSVRQFSDAFCAQYDRLDLLINNAGVMIPPYSKTADGFELQMGTNHLGHFALTAHLMKLLLKTENSRIANVSSIAHKQGTINLDDLAWEERSYKAMKAYADSKIANLYFTYELTRKLEGNPDAPMVTAAHPGWTGTDLQRHSGLFSFLNRFFAQDISMGALPTLYAAVGPTVESGDYYGPEGLLEFKGYPKKVPSNRLSRNGEIAANLWRISEKLTGVQFDFATSV